MFKTLKILLFILICMTGCQKHIVEPDVQEVYIEKIETNQKLLLSAKTPKSIKTLPEVL